MRKRSKKELHKYILMKVVKVTTSRRKKKQMDKERHFGFLGEEQERENTDS